MLFASDFQFYDDPVFRRPWQDGCGTRLKAQLDVLMDIFYLANKRGEKNLLMPGDWYEKWSTISTVVHSMVSTTLYCLLSQYPDITMYMIPGNHDMPHRSIPSINTLAGYQAHPRINVINSPEVHEIEGVTCGFLPYHEDEEWLKTQCNSLFSAGASVLIAHLDLVGGKCNDKYTSKAGLNLEFFKDKFTHIFSGHYHTPQEFQTGTGTFYYVGSPMQHKWEDAGHKHGIMIWNPGSLPKRITIRAPEFISFEASNPPDSLDEKNYYHITCTPEEMAEVEAKYNHLPCLQVSTVAAEVRDKEELPGYEYSSNYDAVETYVETRGPMGLDPELLLSYGRYYAEEEI